MNPGIVALGAVFSFAALLMAWQLARGRGIRRRLLESGFVACDDEAPRILEELHRMAPGFPPAPRREYEIGRCLKRAAGRGVLYRCALVDRTNVDRPRDNAMGARFDLYLLDLPDPERVARGPVSVFLAPSGPAPLRALLAGLVKLDPHGFSLELPGDPQHAAIFLAAFSDRAGRLDERLPATTRERLMRAAGVGCLVAHFAAGKLALLLLPDRVDVDRQLAYVSEWA